MRRLEGSIIRDYGNEMCEENVKHEHQRVYLYFVLLRVICWSQYSCSGIALRNASNICAGTMRLDDR